MDRRGVAWKAVGALAGATAGAATRLGLRGAWRKARNEEPPDNPAGRSTSWPDALLWAVGSGVALAVARLVAERAAAGVWKGATGFYPDEVRRSGAAA